MSPFIALTGKSNKDYVFTVLPINKKLPNSAGVYVVTSTIPDNEGQVQHTPLQIGSCDNLSKRFDENNFQEIRNTGSKRVCIKIEEIMENRKDIEQDLKDKYLF